MTDRLHPESIRQLRQLVKLHGSERLIAEIKLIERQEELAAMSRLFGPEKPDSSQKK